MTLRHSNKKAPAELVEAIPQGLSGHKAANHCRLRFDNSQRFQYRILESNQVFRGYEPRELPSLSPGAGYLSDVLRGVKSTHDSFADPFRVRRRNRLRKPLARHPVDAHSFPLLVRRDVSP